MKWSKIPGFLWPLVIKYYSSRIVRMRVPVLVSSRVYFLLLALPLGVTISKKDNLYQVCSYGNAPIRKNKKTITAVLRELSLEVMLDRELIFAKRNAV